MTPNAGDPSRPQPIRRLADVTFPARDRAMARVAADLSEPESGPPADNLLSNEDSTFRVADRVAALAPPGGVYLGVGPDQNFSLIAPGRPDLAFVVDFRRRNALLHLAHKALMLRAPTRVDYLARLLARTPGPLPPDPTAADLVAAFDRRPLDRARLDAEVAAAAEILRPLDLVRPDEWPALAALQRKLAGPGLDGRFLALPMYPTFGRQLAARDRAGQPGHFLARESSYQLGRDLPRGDRLIPLVGDFAADADGCLPRLAAWLRARRLAVATFYLADVEFFLARAGRYPAFAAHLHRLPWLPGAILIRTSTREIPHPDRLPGASSTTIVRPAAAWLDRLATHPAPTLDDLFR